MSGVQKMSVGHQIGDKSHTIGKSYNARTNEEMDTHDFINLDEGGYTYSNILYCLESWPFSYKCLVQFSSWVFFSRSCGALGLMFS